MNDCDCHCHCSVFRTSWNREPSSVSSWYDVVCGICGIVRDHVHHVHHVRHVRDYLSTSSSLNGIVNLHSSRTIEQSNNRTFEHSNMSNPKAPRPQPFRSSHLRKVSIGSSTAAHQHAANSATEAIGSQPSFSDFGKFPNSNPNPNPNPSVRRVCSLTIHDESFSAEDVVVNLSHFPVDNIHQGDLLYVRTRRLVICATDDDD